MLFFGLLPFILSLSICMKIIPSPLLSGLVRLFSSAGIAHS